MDDEIGNLFARMMLGPRPYIGYEDYSPEGRAAIGAFNAAGGPNVLSRQLATSPQYQAAKQAALLAGQRALLMQQERDNADMNFGSLSTGKMVPRYQYPPKE